jgi:ribosome-associated translation inhibitor RaiA
MKAILAAEHFDLTSAIRSHTEEQLERLRDRLPEEAVLRVFLGIAGPEEFTVLLKTNYRGRSQVVRTSGPDLYACVCRAISVLRRKFQRQKDRRISRRKAHEQAIAFEARAA